MDLKSPTAAKGPRIQRVSDGEPTPDVDAILEMESSDLVGVLTGRYSFEKAISSGRMCVLGEIAAALRFDLLLRKAMASA